ncbi:MAG: hypothetical protein RIB93_22615 [Coleofasciculus sp. D1-CHI-01]
MARLGAGEQCRDVACYVWELGERILNQQITNNEIQQQWGIGKRSQ